MFHDRRPVARLYVTGAEHSGYNFSQLNTWFQLLAFMNAGCIMHSIYKLKCAMTSLFFMHQLALQQQKKTLGI